MKQNIRVFGFVAVVLVIISVVIYLFSSQLSSFRDTLLSRINTKSFVAEHVTVKIINNSKQLKVDVHDKNKLAQVIRSYPQLFEKYDSVELTFEDNPQLINYGWGEGSVFGYTIAPNTDNTLRISLSINVDEVQAYNWSLTNISNETESLFINSLERATINLDSTRSDTRSETEEQGKSSLIDENTKMTLDRLYADNDSMLFTVKLL